jgi:hypothetical protein
MFGNGGADLRDDFLGSILKRLRKYADQSRADSWLTGAADSWFKIYDTMAPGCRSIELQDWLTSAQRPEEFTAALEWVRQDQLRSAAAGDLYPDVVPSKRPSSN